jgi:hypothetical protein
MNKNSRRALLALLMLASGQTVAAPAALSATIVPLTNGGQASIAVSNTDPNLFTVAGDRVTALTSLDGELTRQEQTASGGVIVSTLNKKPSRSFWKPNAASTSRYRPCHVRARGEPSGWSASCPVRVKRRAPGKSLPLRGHAGFPEPASAGRAASVRLAGYPRYA